MNHTVVILVHSSVSEDEGGTNFIPPPSELILRFLLDTDFFFDALVIIVPGVTSSKSPKSSSKLSTDPPRFLKLIYDMILCVWCLYFIKRGEHKLCGQRREGRDIPEKTM